MKTIEIQLITLIIAITFFGFASIEAMPSEDESSKASIEWIKKMHDFGKIAKNEPVKAEFEFKNNSLVPLVINYVKPSCGCTVANYPKEPVQPGKTAKIAVGFDAKRAGYFTKSVTVGSNATEGKTVLYIKGEVISNL
jgi:hypothetical protein